MSLSFILYLCFITVVLGFLGSFAWAAISIAPWVPISKKELERLDACVQLQPGQLFVELGSGDGRVSAYIAKKYPEVQVIGVELSFPVYLLSRIKNIDRPKNLTFVFGDAYAFDISGADVVYTYALIESINTKLKEKFYRELKSSARVVSYVFRIKEWKGSEDIYTTGPKSKKIYVYQKNRKKQEGVCNRK